jgi:hypothetical protein
VKIVKNITSYGWAAKVACLVDQKTNNPKLKGSNPAAVGLVRK